MFEESALRSLWLEPIVVAFSVVLALNLTTGFVALRRLL